MNLFMDDFCYLCGALSVILKSNFKLGIMKRMMQFVAAAIAIIFTCACGEEDLVVGALESPL